MRRGIHILLSLVLSLSLFSCHKEEDKDMLRCTIIMPYQIKSNGNRLCNGDDLKFEYLSQFDSQLIVTFSESENSTVLQSEKFKIKRGEGEVHIVVDVGEYVGRGCVKVDYLYARKDKLMSESTQWRGSNYYVDFYSDEL